MTPLQIIQKLRDYQSLTAQKRFLSNIPVDSTFWFEAHHGLSHFTPYPYQFVVQEQKHSGQVAYKDAPNVMTMILKGMIDGSLRELDFGKAVYALSVRARPDEWENWYEPVLTKRLRLPVANEVFNQYAPADLRVPGFPVANGIPITEMQAMPQEFFMEPLITGDYERVLWFLHNGEVRSFLTDGTEWDHFTNKLFHDFLLVGSEDASLVIEGFMEENSITLTDINDVTMFLTGGRTPMPMDSRYEALEGIREIMERNDVPNIWCTEHHRCLLDTPQTTREAFNTIIQQGYEGAVMRHNEPGYGVDATRVVVHPTKKSILTCTKLLNARPETKYAGGVEYVVGKGTLSRKKFESPVFSGLTFDDRMTILQERDQYLGRKFEVLSCGLGPDGKLVFPIIKKWRK